MEAFRDVDLTSDARAALQPLVKRLGEAVLNILRDASLTESICSICLVQGQEPELDVVPPIFAGRDEDRARIRQEATSWLDVWDPYAFRDEEDAIHPVMDDDGSDHYVRLDAAGVAQWSLVRDALEPLVLSPADWVLARVAHELNRVPLPVPGTDDLAVWVFVEDFDAAELLEQLEYVLRPDTRRLLEQRGLLGRDPEGA